MPPGSHSVIGAVILSFFIPGAGQMLNKQYGKGAVILAMALFGWFFVLIIAALTMGVGILIIPVAWVMQLIDAGTIAGRLNRGEAVRIWQSF